MRRRPTGTVAASALALICFCVLSLASCGGVPQQQLIGFATAFQEAQTAGLLIYDEMAKAIDAADEEIVGNDRYPISLGPTTLTASACEERYARYPDLIARCDAFTAAVAYNDALLLLAQGGNAQQTLGRLETALGAITSLAAIAAPGVGTFLQQPALAALKAILGEALAIVDRARLKAKLDEGAPIVAELLQALRSDADLVYTAARDRYALRLTEVEGGVIEALAVVNTRVDGRAPPTSADALVAFRAAEVRLDAVLGRAEPAFPVKRLAELMNPNGLPLSSADVAALTQAVAPAEQEMARFDAIAKEWNAPRQAIGRYAQMLAALQTSLQELQQASDDPFARGGATEQLAASIAAIKGHAEEIVRLLQAR